MTSLPAAGAAPALITIRMPSLSLPDPAAVRGSYTRSERVSVATLTLVAAYVLRLISQDRTRHKIVLLDEVSFLLGSVQGRQIIDRLVRLGRALNATVLLGTQLVQDLGSLTDLIGVYFIFGQDSDPAARRALQVLGLDREDENLVRLLREQRAGLCLMRDLDGRICQAQIDPVSPQLLTAFSTTPGSQA